MSKKWNDPDARDNYALLITLDNIIISFIFMYVNYSVATNFLSGKFLEYSIRNLKVPVILIGNRISQKFYTKKQPQTD